MALPYGATCSQRYVEIKTKSKEVPYVSKDCLKHTNIAQGS